MRSGDQRLLKALGAAGHSTGETQYQQDVHSPKIYKFNTTPIKIPGGFFLVSGNWQTDSKSHVKSKDIEKKTKFLKTKGRRTTAATIKLEDLIYLISRLRATVSKSLVLA